MNCSWCDNFKVFATLVVIIQLIFGVGRYVYQQFIRPTLYGDSINFKKYGKWALVTGATDGIGKEYARSLAKRGLKIILVSRTASKLEVVAKEIEKSFKVETATIAVDFTSPGVVIYEKIKKEIIGKEVGILVNNVGMANAAWDVFLTIPDLEKHIQDLIQCNVTSVPMMCSLILPQMVERKKGLIINLASTAALVPTPCMTVYAATKAFVHKFSQDLAMEYEDQGIVVQSVCPGPVATPLIRMNKGNLIAPNAEVYVESAIKTIESAPTTAGYFVHSITICLSNLVTFICPALYKKIVITRNFRERDRVVKKGYYEK